MHVELVDADCHRERVPHVLHTCLDRVWLVECKKAFWQLHKQLSSSKSLFTTTNDRVLQQNMDKLAACTVSGYWLATINSV